MIYDQASYPGGPVSNDSGVIAQQWRIWEMLEIKFEGGTSIGEQTVEQDVTPPIRWWKFEM